MGSGESRFRGILVVYFHHYTPNIELAFNSVEYITRDVPNGWLIRYIHGAGARGNGEVMERNRKKVASFRKASVYLKLEEFNLGNLSIQRRLDLLQLLLTSRVRGKSDPRFFVTVCTVGGHISSNKLVWEVLFLFVLEAHKKFCFKTAL